MLEDFYESAHHRFTFDGVEYIRFSENNFMRSYGDCLESCYSEDEKLEKLFQEYIKENALT